MSENEMSGKYFRLQILDFKPIEKKHKLHLLLKPTMLLVHSGLVLIIIFEPNGVIR